jgi:phosphate transport system permease protein
MTSGMSRRRRKDRALELLSAASVLLPIAALALILGKIAWDGLRRLDLAFLVDNLSHRPERTGVLPALMGSAYIVAITAILAAPVGVAAGIFLEEFAPAGGRLSKALRLATANLAGVPSIVYGLVGLAAFVRFLQLGPCVLSGALTLALVVLPMIVVVTQQALRSVPEGYREASIALGANVYQSVRFQVLPAAAKGIWTGLLLAVSRAAGETAPLIVVGAAYFVTRTPRTPLDSYTVLPMQIFSWSSDARREFHADAAAATLVLVVVSLGLNVLVYRLRSRHN